MRPHELYATMSHACGAQPGTACVGSRPRQRQHAWLARLLHITCCLLLAACSVDVTCDEGVTWEAADIEERHTASHGQAWAWVKWQLPVKVSV